ncbi:hypothetical protein [Niveispirillum fermenti]|uniref:hypothetical protein n=1 Tax=Niveispirillum fermenti TaxID=1233113 RepID=UPI003A87A259
MVVDMRTRLPYSHITSHAATLSLHAERLNQCAADLSTALLALQSLDVRGLMADIEND